MTADVTFHINIGPPVLWCAALWIFGWALCFVWNVATIKQQMSNARHVESLVYQQAESPWQAPQPAVLVQRVDPKTANIIRHWGAEEEDIDDAA